MGGVQQMVIVTLFVFLAGLVFHAGRLAARVDQLERSFETHRVELKEEMKTLVAMLRAAIGERRNWRESQK
jgi:hypothetical protein